MHSSHDDSMPTHERYDSLVELLSLTLRRGKPRYVSTESVISETEKEASESNSRHSEVDPVRSRLSPRLFANQKSNQQTVA